MKRSISLLLSIIYILSGVIVSEASTPLITSADQLDTNAPNTNETYRPLSHLLDDDPNSIFLTDSRKEGEPGFKKEQHYLTVKMPETFSMKPDENLVVVLGRPNRIDENTPTQRNPTAIEIHYSFNGVDWENNVLARVYFINRGSGTTELSEPLPFADLNKRIVEISGDETKSINDVKALKFIVTQNNGKYIVGYDDAGHGIRPMILAGFQIYKVRAVDSHHKYEMKRVVNNWVDRFHLITDINYSLEDYTFDHTQGVLEEKNRRTNAKDFNELTENGDTIQIPKDDPCLNDLKIEWETAFQNGQWTKDVDQLAANGIQMPDYSWVTKYNDPLDPNKQNPVITDENLKLQRTATVEHLLYAVQGEPIVLYPFYTLHSVDQYKENFIHWYDYRTGGHVKSKSGDELLGFVADASDVFYSRNHGWYTSQRFTTDSKIIKLDEDEFDTVDFINIENVEDFVKFAERVNKGEQTLNGRITAEVLDFTEYINSGNKVSPIGNADYPYCGNLVGSNTVIRGLVMTSTGEEGVGLIGVSGNCNITNIILDETCIFEGYKNIGVVGMKKNGNLFISGVVNNATIKGYANAGGFIGVIDYPTQDSKISIENCAFNGVIKGTNDGNKQNAYLIGWMRDCSNNSRIDIILKDLLITSKSTGFDGVYPLCRYSGDNSYHVYSDNCYGPVSNLNFTNIGETDVNTEEFLTGNNLLCWETGALYALPTGAKAKFIEFIPSRGKAKRSAGSFATFMYPRKPFENSGNLRHFEDGEDEFVIAADMALNFNLDDNVDNSAKTITEPVIQFRHIFRVKDGKVFADKYMSDKSGNDTFIEENRRLITATAGKPFQIRLDHPYPAERTTRGVFYYKINNDDYRRICSRKIRVKKKNDNGEYDVIQEPKGVSDMYEMNEDATFLELDVNGQPKKKNDPSVKFYTSGIFDGQGSRNVDGTTYYICGGGGHFFRMLECDGIEEGTYIVQVIGTDYDGDIIKLADSPESELLVQEFEITFLPKEKSLMVTEKELKEKYSEFSPENLGKPSSKIDFDQYKFLETLPNMDNYLATRDRDVYSGQKLDDVQGFQYHYFRWPVPWEQSNYGFGYNIRGDYAMQMIVNHQGMTPYHSYGLSDVDNYGKGHGLYDRKFYDSGGDDNGYFYYVNAADDPGIIARLRLEEFCPGTTIRISCWIAEFSSSEESANLAFNFVARLKNGERVPIHSHITGYVGQLGKADFSKRNQWLYVYSSFVPILTDKEISMENPIDHYEIEIDNNSKSSLGADYAVDDIRVYTVKPQLYANQLSPVCDKETQIKVRVSGDFDVLLQNLGISEAITADNDESIDLFYTIIDKKKFDEAVKQNKSEQEIFDNSVVRFVYDTNDESNETYGHLTLHTHFKSNLKYKEDEPLNSNEAYWLTEGSTDLIVFNIDPSDTNMKPGKEYIIAILTKNAQGDFGGGIKTPTGELFILQGVMDQCAKMCVLTVQGSHVIKIDGVLIQDADEINACKNQSPIVQVDLMGRDENGNLLSEPVEKNAIFDWFDGSMEEFVEIEGLWDALDHFRQEYPDATDLSDDPRGEYIPEMKSLIAYYAEKDPEGEREIRLYLGSSSYIFPPLILPEGETQKDEYVLAIPITHRYEGKLICTQPTEVHIVVKERAPLLAHGIAGITYPKTISDVPMRISKRRIDMAFSDMSSSQSNKSPVVLPFRTINPVSDGVQKLIKPTVGSPVCLAATNDPQYKNLAPLEVYEHLSENDKLWTVGEVQELKAVVGDFENSEVKLVFFNEVDGEEGIKFKEGYEYRMRFLFKEESTGGNVEDLCSGHVVFTVKIVPEYQEWTGKENLNWNNDENWRRVDSKDILADKAADGFDAKYGDFVTDGNNSQPFSYAPLDFTKTIIPHGAKVPELFEVSTEKKAQGGRTYDWNPNPSENEKKSGVATPLVQYDMIERRESDGTYCRPWLAHWCDQIHFESGAEIGHQQWLNYNKAWVDFETAPSRWYTLSSPLQGAVAGDMYLPTAGARQETTYFEDINFVYGPYNRFRPAVFQRSWDTASATVYKFEGEPNNTTDVKVETNWSNVYNDVEVSYKTGLGFSIKTDLADMEGERPEKVMFRLPKADTVFSYFTDDGHTKDGDDKTISRPANVKMNPTEGTITVRSASNDNRLFLVGNPFMAHLDMKQFLEKNSDVIEPKYWILDGDHQGAVVMYDDHEHLVGTVESPEYVAPMQGFFVEKKKQENAVYDGTSLTLSYDADMAVTVNDIPDVVNIGTRGAEENSMGLRISAKESGSSALLLFDNRAEEGYLADEDAMFVSDETLGAKSLVYTVADGVATTVNVLPEVIQTEIGVISVDDEPTTLVFDGVDSAMGLMIYDALNGTYTNLYDGMELKVQGSASKRLYLVNGTATEITADLEILLVGNRVKVNSPNGGLMVRIYDVSGLTVDSSLDGGSEAEFRLSKGIYIVEAGDSVSKKTKKILIR